VLPFGSRRSRRFSPRLEGSTPDSGKGGGSTESAVTGI